MNGAQAEPRRDGRLPRLVVTGSSGFLGRHLLARIRNDYRIYGIARRSQARSGAPVHPNISWDLIDIGDRPGVFEAFQRIADDGPVEAIIHLAAHYDFTGEPHREYTRTNVEGLRNVLEASRLVRPQRFVFASSVAACKFPAPGSALTEESAPNGIEPYSVSKRLGEAMLQEYEADFPYCIVRFAAMFSDWCEYPPLYVFLRTWLSTAWNRRILGGRGRFGVPYLHVRDAALFMMRLLDRMHTLPSGQVLLASTDGSTSVGALFKAATEHTSGRAESFLYLPRPVCAVGMAAREIAGRMAGQPPFERAWMARYIDRQLAVDAEYTRRLLGWKPRERLMLPRRLPFLLENRRYDPLHWRQLNHEAMKHEDLSANLKVHRLLQRHENEIADRLAHTILDDPAHFPSYAALERDVLRLNSRTALRSLMTSVLTQDKTGYVSFCRDLAERRHVEGFAEDEVCGALRLLREISMEVTLADPEAKDVAADLEHLVSSTLRFGCDSVEDVFDQLGNSQRHNGLWPTQPESSAEIEEAHR